MSKSIAILVASILVVGSAVAQPVDLKGDYTGHLYQITLLRASPGGLADLVSEVKSYRSSVDGDVLAIRHSQGDHWDLMLLEPAGDDPLRREDWPVAFQDDFLASSDWNWERIRRAGSRAGLFHIEMFHAVEGMKEALLREREMENEYLVATGRDANAIFMTRFGSDVDAFTIGFYSDMIAFATDPDLTDAEYHKAATDAGFESRATIGEYLRHSILMHFDTLGVQVR